MTHFEPPPRQVFFFHRELFSEQIAACVIVHSGAPTRAVKLVCISRTPANMPHIMTPMTSRTPLSRCVCSQPHARILLTISHALFRSTHICVYMLTQIYRYMSNLITSQGARVPDSPGSEHITAQSDIARDLLWKVHGLDRVCLSCGTLCKRRVRAARQKKLCNQRRA